MKIKGIIVQPFVNYLIMALIMLVLPLSANIYWAFSMCQAMFQRALYINDYLVEFLNLNIYINSVHSYSYERPVVAICLGHLGSLSQNTTNWWLKQQLFIAYSSGDRQVQDQGPLPHLQVAIFRCVLQSRERKNSNLFFLFS